MATPPFSISEGTPADDDIVSQFPAAERTFRDVVEDWMLTHSDTYGNITILSLTTTDRDAITTWAVGNAIYNSTTMTVQRVTSIGPVAWLDIGTAATATETVSGILEVATEAEVEAFTADDKVVTPKKLHDADLTLAGKVTHRGDLIFDAYETIASVAGTTDLSALTSNNASITGTNAITGFGTGVDGMVRFCKAVGALPIVFSANIVGPAGETSGTYTFVAGSHFIAHCHGSGVWAVEMGAGFATQAMVEAETNTTTALNSANVKYAPGIAKAWVQFNGATTGSYTPNTAYNVSTVERTGAGLYTITFTVSFSGTGYVMMQSVADGTNFTGLYAKMVSTSAGSCTIRVNANGAATDLDTVNLAFYGDQ